MKRASTLAFQTIIVLVGTGAFVFLVVLPQLEGRAEGLDLFHIYADPFILYGYVVSIAFFVGLYHAFRFIGYLRQGKENLEQANLALRRIRYCVILLGIAIVLAGIYIRLFHHPDDDPAGFLGLSGMALGLCVVVATGAIIMERKVKRK